MDAMTKRTVNDLKKKTVSIESDRRAHIYQKYCEDETRISECIDDIIHLHRDMFLLPRNEDLRNATENRSSSSNGMQFILRKPNDLNKSEDSVKKQVCGVVNTSESPASSSNDSEGIPQNCDTSRMDEDEYIKKVFLDLIKDDEIEISLFVTSLIDNFFQFKRKLVDMTAQPFNKIGTREDVLKDLGKHVTELDQLVCCIHIKYAKILRNIE